MGNSSTKPKFLNFKDFWNLSEESVHLKKEFGGGVMIMIEDGMYRFLHRDTVKGGVKSVNIPNDAEPKIKAVLSPSL